MSYYQMIILRLRLLFRKCLINLVNSLHVQNKWSCSKRHIGFFRVQTMNRMEIKYCLSRLRFQSQSKTYRILKLEMMNLQIQQRTFPRPTQKNFKSCLRKRTNLKRRHLFKGCKIVTNQQNKVTNYKKKRHQKN